MKNLVTFHPFRPIFGHKVGHLTICNVIQICLNVDFANKKHVLVSEGVVNQLVTVFSVTLWIFYYHGGSKRVKTQLRSSILLAHICRTDNFVPKFWPIGVKCAHIFYAHSVWLNMLNNWKQKNF